MTENQFLSRWHFHHNKYHAWGSGDHFTNLTPLLIKEHREQTKHDAKIMAKSRRIQKRREQLISRYVAMGAYHDTLGGGRVFREVFKREKPKRKIQSRGFDKTRSRKMSGKVVKREGDR